MSDLEKQIEEIMYDYASGVEPSAGSGSPEHVEKFKLLCESYANAKVREVIKKIKDRTVIRSDEYPHVYHDINSREVERQIDEITKEYE